MLKDEFIFDAGRYILGDIQNVFSDSKNLNKYLKAIPKSKKKVCDYDDNLDFGYFKILHKDTELVLQDCIEINTLEAPSSVVIIVPEYLVGKKRLKSCRRFESKSEFTLKHEYGDDTLISFKRDNEPGPFMFYVTPFKTELK